ncbi:peptidylprolyl isomerase [Nitrosomonas mobilis]|uniref:Chaperone SurA n=1 Tax=Nitrosomonas mobilis TaxID=51642 RepID=A0A1G5SCK2_9PROT|nr:peptidylprolyl isomerase [Nitrosomonas mobilis]SCZ84550.1 Chaperone SurA [Nitrosomonas mobilis]
MNIKYFYRTFLAMVSLLMSVSFAQPLPDSAGPRFLDRIVVVVDDEVITQQEADEVLQNAIRQLERQGTQLPRRDILEKQILERLILKRIQLQRARELGLVASDGDVEQTLRRIAQENDLSMEAFRQTLQNEGTDIQSFREEIREEILMVRLKEQEVNNRVNVTESEIDNFMQMQENSSIGNDDYRLAHILVQLSEQMDTKQIEVRNQRAQSALESLKQGADFAQVAAEFSDAPDAMQGGVLDWRPVSQMGPLFANLLVTMQIGELTPVIRSPIGFHILKLLDRRERGTSVVIIEQTHAQHILIKINELISENDAYRQIMQIKQRVDKGENFSELAKAFSEDSSASSGGDLNWISPRDTVPEFEKAMNELLPGQVSQPVRTSFGWHLIKVIERRKQDVSDQQRREAARQAIHARKAEGVVQEWMQQLRDQAYVEYIAEDN